MKVFVNLIGDGLRDALEPGLSRRACKATSGFRVDATGAVYRGLPAEQGVSVPC
ncbi:MAG: hypothetical protein IH956_00855 [Chloroflexi bacterium]|nr:hypothetical protein [Chloroflexota bacterium]